MWVKFGDAASQLPGTGMLSVELCRSHRLAGSTSVLLAAVQALLKGRSQTLIPSLSEHIKKVQNLESADFHMLLVIRVETQMLNRYMFIWFCILGLKAAAT